VSFKFYYYFPCLISAIPKYAGNFLLLNQGMATLRIPYNPSSSNPGQPITIQYFQMAIGML
jgi:nidogen (entactin)